MPYFDHEGREVEDGVQRVKLTVPVEVSEIVVRNDRVEFVHPSDGLVFAVSRQYDRPGAGLALDITDGIKFA